MTTLELSRGTALVIVAHPDDETIWMGGAILANKHINWTIFSLCRKDDPDRKPKFLRAAKFYGARCLISDLEDQGLMNMRESVPEARSRILRAIRTLKRRRFTYIFTHGYNGEYGHARHQAVHRAVRALIAKEILTAEQTFTFAYQMSASGKKCLPDKKARCAQKLTPKIFRAKKDIIEKLYGFRKSSFEYLTCSPVETFNRLS